MEAHSATSVTSGLPSTHAPREDGAARDGEANDEQSLDQLLGQPLALARSLSLGAGIAEALGRLHAAGCLHRDVKPANIRVNRASGEARLAGLELIARVPRGLSPAEPPAMLAGTLAYMAPEQTGRMNRSIDFRSDLYSLGVTLYEMLTGTLPFSASDPMEWVHCHVARLPVPPGERVSGLPGPVSALVLKLLAKNPEDRYQTAAGVALDLRRMLADWESLGRLEPFVLGGGDIPDRLVISGHLYGRESAIETLLAAFNRVATSGVAEFLLVSGYSGVGKSSVVNELRKALAARGGLFAAGKFDQQKRNIPYATLAQAFAGLIATILGWSEAELSRWRERIREAVGGNGQLIVNLVPELELVIGSQPAVPALPPRDERNRFHAVLQKFIGVFARAEQPLVLFIDDLQWLDSATLDLFEELLARTDARHLMVIGAFRDNEVSAEHPLARMLQAVRGDHTRVHEIVLAPLSLDDLERFVADTLRCPRERAEPLARMLHQKTRGNPFFAIQFITSLVDDALLGFDAGTETWTWDLAAIQARGHTDNVADLLAERVGRLARESQEALRQLACVGHRAKTETLALIGGDTEDGRHAVLAEALEAGLILRLNGAYAFAHDRIQEAAYAQIPAADRAATHLKIGRSLETHPSVAEREELIFDIVNQFSRAGPLLTAPEERLHVAELNWHAGRRAKAATGFESALAYFNAAEAALPEEVWTRHYALAFGVAYDRAECEIAIGNLPPAQERLERLMKKAANRVDLGRVTVLLTAIYTATDRLDRAIAADLEYLREFGINWSSQPTAEDTWSGYRRLSRLLGDRPIEALIDLPLMANPDWRAAIDVLLAIGPAAKFTAPNLHTLAMIEIATLSIEHGNCDGSCLGYADLVCVLGPHFGDDKAGYRFGQLGLDLVERRGLRRYEAKVYTVVGYHAFPRTKPIPHAHDLMRRAWQCARECGDVPFASFAQLHLSAFHLVMGEPLAEVQKEIERGLEQMQRTGFGLVADCFAGELILAWTLRGLAPDFSRFGAAIADQPAFERHLEADNSLAIAACFYWIRKLQAGYFSGGHADALQASARAVPLFWTGSTYVERAEFYFYDALNHAAIFDAATPERRLPLIDAVSAHLHQLRLWQETCPENFTARVALVAAELARMEGQDLAALRSFEEAIQAARNFAFINEEALCSELAGRFHLARGLAISGNAHLSHARSCYQRWGADGKVRQLDRLYPHLRRSPLLTATAANLSLDQMDLAVVLKASQAISSEIVLERLVESLLQIALEHAGADRGSLILQDGENWKIAAEAVTEAGRIRIARRQTSASPGDLPAAIVHYALRTKEIVIVDDASAQAPYMNDDYVIAKRPKSALCLPLFKQTNQVGALYLENSLATHVFTKDRVAVLKLLASQAAISLENARLYENLREAQTRMNHGERLSLTGSWSWHIATGDIYWSDETYRIWECDRSVTPTFDFVRTRVHPEDLDYFRRVTEEGIREGRDSEFELRLVMPGGALKHIQVARHPVRDERGQLTSFVGAVRDITERKKAGEALQQAQMELAHVARVATLGELTASIAHELNQPLAGVITNGGACLRWLAVDPPNLAEARAAVERMIRDGNRASEVIMRLRTLFRKTATNREPVDVNAMIGEVAALAQSEIRRHRATLRTELADDLPRVVADRVQLQQVAFNLILNAVEAMNGVEHRPLEVLIRTQNDGAGGVRVHVRDSGVGLDPATREKIFEAFHTTKRGGMGMGLSISRSIIENHGGRLWAESHDGPGATFVFALGPQPAAAT